MVQKNSWVRTLYLYLFALIGLGLVIIGAVRLLNLALKIYVFTQADKIENQRPIPPYPPYDLVQPYPAKVPSGGEVTQNKRVEALTPEEKAAFDRWMLNYKSWQDEQSKIDYVRARREQEAAYSFAFVIIGLPLYLYHWAVIKRDRKKDHGDA